MTPYYKEYIRRNHIKVHTCSDPMIDNLGTSCFKDNHGPCAHPSACITAERTPCRLGKALRSLEGAWQAVPDHRCEHGRAYVPSQQKRNNIEDTWSRRASLHLDENLASLKNATAFKNISRYTKAVREISRILEVNSQACATQVNLTNFQHETLSPVRSADLIHSSEHPQENVFYPYFRQRLSSILEEHEPRIVGFSLNYLSQALTTFAMIGLLRQFTKTVKIILGGGLITSWMKRPDWHNPFQGLVDELVEGPGEERILALTGLEGCEGIYPAGLHGVLA